MSFFLSSWGNESESGTNKSCENHFAVHMMCLSHALIHSLMNPEKRLSFLNTMKNTKSHVSIHHVLTKRLDEINESMKRLLRVILLPSKNIGIQVQIQHKWSHVNL